jgi:hypothetical protein
MSTFEEIKRAVAALPVEKQIELDSYIWGTVHRLPVTFSETIDDRMREMDEGKKVRWADIREEVLQREKLPE